MIKITIDDKILEVPEHSTVLEAALNQNIAIPTICENENVKPFVGCRLCLVEIGSGKNPAVTHLLPPCCFEAVEGLIVKTDTERVKQARTFILQLLIARSPDASELRQLARELDIPIEKDSVDPVGHYLLFRSPKYVDTKCILCGLCVRVCEEISERYAISFSGRGINRKVTTPYGEISQRCIGCGLCAHVCPTKAITVEEAG